MDYVQCMLKRENAYQVAWIPTVGKNKVKVRVGCSVELSDTKEFWEVVSMGSRQDVRDVKARERGYLRHRKFSDI